MTGPRVDLVKYRAARPGLSVIGYATVSLPDIGIAVNDIRLKVSDAGHPFTLIPARRDGEGWSEVVSFTGYPARAAFDRAVIAAVLAVYPEALARTDTHEQETDHE